MASALEAIYCCYMKKGSYRGEIGDMTSQSTSIRQTELPLIGIVDDDEAVRDAISSLVRSAGFRAAGFPSVEAFIHSEHVNRAECLILDVRMPGLSGLELQSRLAQMKCSIPIILMTAHADDDVRTRALDRGAVAFLSKPFSGVALLDATHSALSSMHAALVRRTGGHA
jgi:FixJ family two-component response regulator